MLNDRALAVTEIRAVAGSFYDYESKYADGGLRHIIPAMHPDAYSKATWMSRWRRIRRWMLALRVAIFVTTTLLANLAGWCCLKSTIQPGLTPTSLLPEQAAHLGMNFSQLCTWMVKTLHAKHETIAAQFGQRPAFGLAQRLALRRQRRLLKPAAWFAAVAGASMLLVGLFYPRCAASHRNVVDHA